MSVYLCVSKNRLDINFPCFNSFSKRREKKKERKKRKRKKNEITDSPTGLNLDEDEINLTGESG